MKCSNEISYQGNNMMISLITKMIIISNECYSILLNGFVFLEELDKPSESEKYLACGVHLVCVTQKT